MTYVTDPIGDLLARMRNAQHVRHDECLVPWSRLKQQLLELMQAEGWIENVEVIGEDPRKQIVIRFAEDKPRLELKRVSKPGRRVYSGKSDLKPVLHGYGIAILTTSQGLMTDAQAREKNVGGEILCTVA